MPSAIIQNSALQAQNRNAATPQDRFTQSVAATQATPSADVAGSDQSVRVRGRSRACHRDTARQWWPRTLSARVARPGTPSCWGWSSRSRTRWACSRSDLLPCPPRGILCRKNSTRSSARFRACIGGRNGAGAAGGTMADVAKSGRERAGRAGEGEQIEEPDEFYMQRRDGGTGFAARPDRPGRNREAHCRVRPRLS